jgi:quinol monooxygenase YgiN
MAIALIMDFPGGTREQYDEVVERMHLDGTMAPGGLAHVAGSTPGGWRVIDVWEDMAAFGRFREEQIVPHTQAAGLAEPTVQIIEVDELMRGGGTEPTFAQCVHLEGMDAERFAAMDRHVLPDGNRPDDVVWHVHGPVDDGWLVIDTWTSKAARDRFIQERIMPAMQQAGATGPPDIEDMDVAASMRAGAAVS